nr:3'(2'),5'-bisphosphate nucleotidase CysQ [Mesorhizobium sp.]
MTASKDQAIQRLFEQLALVAGRKVLEIFHAGCEVSEKPDSSPVTDADHAAEAIILDGLRTAYPEISCVAEEEAAAGILPADLGNAFFLIDPLDGTKEFIKRSGDFTVNIALVRDGNPEVGVVYAPYSGRFFSGRPGMAEILDVDAEGKIDTRRPISVRHGSSPLTVVASRSHRTAQTDAFIQECGPVEILSVGSSLKFCMIACGEADIYPRHGRTMEWDTAAGDAILRAAGGMTYMTDGNPLPYGKRNQADESDFANPDFVARGATPGAPRS